MFTVKMNDRVVEASCLYALETIFIRRSNPVKGATTYRIVRKPENEFMINTLKVESFSYGDASFYVGDLTCDDVNAIIRDAYEEGKVDLSPILNRAKYVKNPKQIPDKGVYYGSVCELDSSNLTGFMSDEIVTIDGGSKPRVYNNPFGSSPDPFGNPSDDTDEDDEDDWDETETEIDFE